MEKSAKKAEEWIKLQSKSRPGRYYLFNKKTGETQWVPQTKQPDSTSEKSLEHTTTTEAPPKLPAPKPVRTHAQDRLKRLQHTLKSNQIRERERKPSDIEPKISNDQQENKKAESFQDSPAKKSKSSLSKRLLTTPKKTSKRLHQNDAETAKDTSCTTSPIPSKKTATSISTNVKLSTTNTEKIEVPSSSKKRSPTKRCHPSQNEDKPETLKSAFVKKIKEICKTSFNALKKSDEKPLAISDRLCLKADKLTAKTSTSQLPSSSSTASSENASLEKYQSVHSSQSSTPKTANTSSDISKRLIIKPRKRLGSTKKPSLDTLKAIVDPKTKNSFDKANTSSKSSIIGAKTKNIFDKAITGHTDERETTLDTLKAVVVPKTKNYFDSSLITSSKSSTIVTKTDNIFVKANTSPTDNELETSVYLTPKNVFNITKSYKTGSANDRLNRLRQSFKQQQQSNKSDTSFSSYMDHMDDSSTTCATSPTTSSLNASLNSTSKSLYVTAIGSTDDDEPEAMEWEPIAADESSQISIDSSPFIITKTNDASDINCNLSSTSNNNNNNNNTTSYSTSSNYDDNDSSTIGELYDSVNENLLRIVMEKNRKKSKWQKDKYYFVVDTNVLLRTLCFVDDLTKMKLCDTNGSILYLPYCALQELDILKMRSGSQEGVKTLAIRAIKYINEKFEKNSPHLQAQSAKEEREQLISVSSADDSIINCCLQAKAQVPNVLLLTEDVNLRNKAISNSINVSNKSDLINKQGANEST